MGSDAEKSHLDYLETTIKMERRMRNIFVGSMSLSVLVLLNFAYLVQPAGTLSIIVRVSFPSVLLWSFTLTGYAFYTCSRLSNARRRLLEDRLITDPRTGLKSLDYMRKLIQKEYERATQTGQSTSVLYVDLDNLDMVNKNFGHAIGDIVLKDLAINIEKGIPAEGSMGHLAGDEFVVVLPGTKLEKADSIAEAIKQRVREYRLDLGKRGTVDFLGCRVGIISCPQEGSFADEIINFAQKAANESKKS